MSSIHKGSCLCGAVAVSVAGPLREVVYCHCGQCRKQTGLYYAASNAMNGDVTVSGGEHVTWYHSSETGRRGFCKVCGSALFWKSEGADHLSIMAGIFDKGTPLVAGHHIFCEDKGDFYEVADGLPQHAKSPPVPVTGTD